MLYTTPPLRMARLRFEIRPREVLHLAPEIRGEVLYGAMKTVVRRIACDPGCPGASSCARRLECAYAQMFDPASPNSERLGEKDARRAFLIRPPLDAGSFTPRTPLIFELRLFGEAIHASGLFIDAFRRLESSGLADRAVDLVSVLSLDWKGTSAHILFEGGQATDAGPLILGFESLMQEPVHGGRLRIEFETPTLLKYRRTVQRQPVLEALVRRLLARIALLTLIWEGKEWQADHCTIGELAGKVTSRVDSGGWKSHQRHSSRTNRNMPVEGFCGIVTYDQVPASLWPLLRIGQEIHVGQHVVWGNGRYRFMDG